MQIGLDSHPAWIIACLLIGAAYAFVLYRRDDRFSNALKYTMAGIRFALVSAICFLLLSPNTTSWEEQLEPPIVAWMSDNSQSMQNTTEENVQEHAAAEVAGQLSNNERFQLDQLSFDQSLHVNDSLSFDGVATNMSGALSSFHQLYKQQNLSAVVLHSDGMYNRGYNPELELDKFDVPIFTLVAGDTSQIKDGAITDVNHKKLVYRGNKFPLEVSAKVTNGAGSSLKLSVLNKNGVLTSRTIKVTSNLEVYNETFYLPTEEVGLQSFKVRLSSLDGEHFLDNNEHSFYVEVIDNKKQILVLSPVSHPDIGAVMAALHSVEEYEVVLKKPDEINASLNEYDVVLFFQYPLGNGKSMNSYIASYKGNALYFIGPKTNINGINRFQPYFSLTGRAWEESQAYETKQVAAFTLDEALLEEMETWPPVNSLISQISFKEGFEHLAKARSLGVDTDVPMLSFATRNNVKVGLINAEGLWRWRLYNYKEKGSHDLFDQMIRQMIRFLSSQENLDRFKLDIPKRIVAGDALAMMAQLYDPGYELTSQGEVNITLEDEEGKAVSYRLSPGIDHYTFKARGLKAGWYEYAASATLGQEEFVKKGKLLIEPLMLEQQAGRSNFELMQNIAKATGGKVYLESDAEGLLTSIEALSHKPRMHQFKHTTSWMHLKWIFALLMLLLAIEWFLRKHGGAY